jgi:hypothetical protein
VGFDKTVDHINANENRGRSESAREVRETTTVQQTSADLPKNPAAKSTIAA